jgi:formamidase
MLRYSAAAIQTDLPAPRDRSGYPGAVKHLLSLIDRVVIGYAPFAPVKLIVFPEHAHVAPIYFSAAEIDEHLALPLPNEYLDAYFNKAKQHDVFILTSFLEKDDEYPGHVFNTACLVGPTGLLLRYRKVHPWLPWEVHTSPHDLPDWQEPLFPVADTPIGKIGVAIGSDWMFPEAVRQLALNGAEILLRPAASMDPWGATPPLDWWNVVNRCRAIENLAYVVACNQGASARNQPPYSWPGGSMVVDYDGRTLAQADAGPGERLIVAPIDVEALRHERRARSGHHFLAQLRTEAYLGYGKPVYPRAQSVPGVQENEQALEEGKKRLGG